MNIPRNEQETHLNMVATDRDYWEIYSDDPVMIKKFKKLNYKFRDVEHGSFFKVPANLVIFRKDKR